jgi:hypothetical protein
MVVMVAMLVVWGGGVKAKVKEAATVAAEETCGGRVAAVQCDGGGGVGGNSSGVGKGKGEGEGSGDGSDVGRCGDFDCGGGGNSNNDSNGGDGNSNSSSGVDGNSDACFHHG